MGGAEQGKEAAEVPRLYENLQHKDVDAPNATEPRASKWPEWEPRCVSFTVMKNSNSGGPGEGCAHILHLLLFLM